MKPNTVSAQMEWKGRGAMAGRILYCNSIPVARILDVDRHRWFCLMRCAIFPTLGREYRTEAACRRNANKAFGLPLDFGEKQP